MKDKIYVIILLLFLSKLAKAQKITENIPHAKNFLNSLYKNKTDTILIFSTGCTGCEVVFHEPIDTSVSKPYFCNCNFGDINLYFIWKKSGHSYLKRFDYCSSFKTIKLAQEPKEIFNFYYQNTITWRKEKAFWKHYKTLSIQRKFKYLPAHSDHYSFDELYYNKYEFSLADYEFKSKG